MNFDFVALLTLQQCRRANAQPAVVAARCNVHVAKHTAFNDFGVCNDIQGASATIIEIFAMIFILQIFKFLQYCIFKNSLESCGAILQKKVVSIKLSNNSKSLFCRFQNSIFCVPIILEKLVFFEPKFDF